MFGLALVGGFGILALLRGQTVSEVKRDIPQRISEKLDELWKIAQQASKEKKYLRAEKALLTILRVDERNATAYNRLGILYAKQKAFKDAVECFEIAQSLEPSSSSLHNVGLIHYETGHYSQAALAFEQAIKMEDDFASRHIAYAKVQEKLGNTKRMIAALERAVELEQNPQTLRLLAEAYEEVGQTDLALDLREKSARLVIPQNKPKSVKKHPRRVSM